MFSNYISKIMTIFLIMLTILNLNLLQSRNLQLNGQSNALAAKYGNSTCFKTSTKPDTGSECFIAGDTNTQCCFASFWSVNTCFPIGKNSIEAQSIQSYANVTNLKIFASSKLSGNIEMRCQNDPISQIIKDKVSICANSNDPSPANCAKLSDSDVQCCYISASISSANLNYNSCIGFNIPIKIPSYVMNYKNNPSSILCTLDDLNKKTMDSCASVSPKIEADCLKLSYGNVRCLFATVEKNNYICMGVIGDIKSMKNLNLAQNLQNVEISFNDQLSININNIGNKLRYWRAFILTLTFYIILF